ncbi:MAG TPA: pentapeptide repeat-containing protein [Oligoflexus sp.]|uniref:pentapeptide repeat-containing protein n=1 Tax=Oligoflexus sp. TaxID=1971216 RepID=UPI002D7E5132|nr:pentapeptide repeat-containing protein [Oligoflexus sp.]HET9238301.1 pentapeptide repeat-containing protein [Oligoflexus sp.]
MPSLKAPFAFVLVMLLTGSMMGCMPKNFKDISTTDNASAIQKLDVADAGAEAEKSGESDESSTTAIEPTSIAGGFLMDPKKLFIQRSGGTVDIKSDSAAVVQMPSGLPKDADIELYAYDSATRNFEASGDYLILNLKKLAATRALPDGSFTVQASIASSDWLFIKVADSSGATLRVSPKEPKSSIVWIDSDGNRPRSLDQASAHTLRGLISPTATLLEAIDRLRTTKACVDCDLNGADLRGQNWNAYNFMGAKLMGAKFNNSSITNSDLRNTDLRAADFSFTFLAFSDFTGAVTTGANFEGADTQNAIGLVISP